MTRFAICWLIAGVATIALAQESTPPTELQAPAVASLTAEIEISEIPTDELKLRLVPLTLEELEAVRERVLEVLRSQADTLAGRLIELRRLEKAPDKDTDALAAMNEIVAGLVESKAELVSRATIVLAAIEGKGGDTKQARQYVASVDGLRPEEPVVADEPVDVSEEEQKAAAVRGRVGELIGVVRAEPPVHERPKPWEVPVAELRLEMQPLTLEQIQARLAKWQELLENAVRRRIRYDILLNNAQKLESVQKTREDAAMLAGVPATQADKISLDDIKEELAAQSQAQQAIIGAIVERMDAAIRLIEMRGGDAQKYADYIASATGQTLNLYDPTILYAQVMSWLVAPDGGVKIGLNVVLFVSVFIAFWLASIIFGWMAGFAVGRLPKTSSLLKPLLVSTVRRLTVFIGLITAISMLGVNVGPLLAMIGAAGLVIGLALQGTLSNFASGILILINRPYDVGDVIQAGGVLGKVEAMNLVSTRVLTFDNQIMLVPNNEIWNGVITNITGRATRRVDLTFGIAYSDDIGKAIGILEETLKAHPKVLSDPAPLVRVHELGDSSVNIIARPWSRTEDYWDVYWDLMREVKQRFDADGINIPFPQRDLHVPGPIEVVWSDRKRNGAASGAERAGEPVAATAKEPGPGDDGE